MKRRIKKWMLLVTGILILSVPIPGTAANNAPPPAPKALNIQPGTPATSPFPKTLPQPIPQKAQGMSAANIRDIRGPVHIPDPMMWVYYGTGGLLFIVMIAALWHVLRKRKRNKIKSAADVAFEALARAKSLMQPEQARAFSMVVSGAVRTYIEDRYCIAATRRTTQEFMAHLKDNPPAALREHTERLKGFLSYCDLAKFARCALSTDQMNAMHKAAWQFVETTALPLDEKAGEAVGAEHQPSRRTLASGKMNTLIAGITRLKQRILKNREIAKSFPMAGTAVTGGQ